MYFGDDSPAQLRTPLDEELVREIAATIREKPDLRTRRLARIKQSVESSDYENELKFSIALDRLLDRVSGEPGRAIGNR